MTFSNGLTMALLIVVACLTSPGDAFAHGTWSHRNAMTTTTTTTALPAQSSPDTNTNNNAVTSRRNALFGFLGVTVAAVVAGSPEEAAAKYSSYAHREQDWEERNKKGEINYKNAKDLRAELRVIAPMNSDASKLFCPNGPSAAVSPLMENRCGDRMAIPSVYGRSQDVVGNSIPGFTTASSAPRGGSLDNTGGFPSYK